MTRYPKTESQKASRRRAPLGALLVVTLALAACTVEFQNRQPGAGTGRAQVLDVDHLEAAARQPLQGPRDVHQLPSRDDVRFLAHFILERSAIGRPSCPNPS